VLLFKLYYGAIVGAIVVWQDFLLAAISALGGGASGASIARAIGQNRNEKLVALQQGQDQFNNRLAARITQLEARQEKQDEAYDALQGEYMKAMAKIQIYDARFEIQANRIAEQAEKLTTLGIDNTELRRENTRLTADLQSLRRQVDKIGDSQ
jgi:hypothetical protein